MKQIDISIPRWMYWSDEVDSLHICPKCKSSLINEHQTYLLGIKQGKEIEPFIICTKGGYFCPDCPTVVLDKEEFIEMAIASVNYMSGYTDSNKFVRFTVVGLVNSDEIPEDKKSVPYGRDDNAIPLVEFLNYRKAAPKFVESGEPPKPIKSQKIGRNEPCPCGSGKKYKKCCGL